ncbi:MAG TPA: ATP-dependent DNA helicase [Sporosarcina sp.]|nr:ATP-dependent DNA helicase [Sporosarcina sp.]
MDRKLPFALTKEQTFYDSLNDWIGDTLYDDLTEKGYECRDEQIFMSFQIEQALKEKKVLFAEAGVGTGKTIAYLLPAIAYARYTGKPALISCADETLIEQLVKREGDIYKMSEALNLNIDVRLAKARDQYLCLKRLEDASSFMPEDYIEEVEDRLPDFVYGSVSLTSVYPYGERSDYPELSDEQWRTINYHPTQQCDACDLRNKCGQTIHRNHYRAAPELIICAHDFYMEHIWTKESRERQGQLPLLPEVSMVIFDEGHLLEFSAQRALTYEVQDHTLLELLERVMVNDVREESLMLMEQLIELHAEFFQLLDQHAEDTWNERKAIDKTPALMTVGAQAVKVATALLEEFVFDAEMYTIPAYELKMVEEYLDQYVYSMELFTSGKDAVDWLQDDGEELSLVIMPRLVTDILKENVFSSKLPIVFSSATLSVQKDFTYIAEGLGVQDHLSFSVPSPFEYEEVMTIEAEQVNDEDKNLALFSALQDDEQTLVLFKSENEMLDFKEQFGAEFAGRIGFEGDRELSSIVGDFQSKKLQILCSYNLWEGLDIPKDALTRVIIHELPYPPVDPLFEAKRKYADDAFEDVDLPFMLLRYRQGLGRLIRTSEDAGSVQLLLNEEEMKMLPELQKVSPVIIQQ